LRGRRSLTFAVPDSSLPPAAGESVNVMTTVSRFPARNCAPAVEFGFSFKVKDPAATVLVTGPNRAGGVLCRFLAAAEPLPPTFPEPLALPATVVVPLRVIDPSFPTFALSVTRGVTVAAGGLVDMEVVVVVAVVTAVVRLARGGKQPESSEVSFAGSVAVAETLAPAGTTRPSVALYVAFPDPSVVTLAKPRNVRAWPKPLGSQAAFE
jgi:hypothetical protein